MLSMAFLSYSSIENRVPKKGMTICAPDTVLIRFFSHQTLVCTFLHKRRFI